MIHHYLLTALRHFRRHKTTTVINVFGLALGLACFIAAQKYLSTFEQRIDLTIWPFAFGVAFTLLIAWLAVGGHAWLAARVRPADVLRHE